MLDGEKKEVLFLKCVFVNGLLVLTLALIAVRRSFQVIICALIIVEGLRNARVLCG